MKYILAILLFISAASNAQMKHWQKGDFIYRWDSTTIRQIPFTINDYKGFELRLISNNNLLATIYKDEGITFWDATLAAANVSDTLAATGITGMCRITVPTTINNQRIIQYGDWAVIYQTTSYTAVRSGIYPLPVTIRRNSDNVAICTISSSWDVEWHVTPAWSWTGRVGTTRIKRITLP